VKPVMTEPKILHVLSTDDHGRSVRYPQTQYALPVNLGPRTLTLTGQETTQAQTPEPPADQTDLLDEVTR
jgi:hypothetical protein